MITDYPRDRIKHLQLRAVQVRHYRHPREGQCHGVMHRRQVMQVQESCVRHGLGLGEQACPRHPPFPHRAQETPTGKRDLAPQTAPQTTDASETAHPPQGLKRT
jgi:hypothetical protein